MAISALKIEGFDEFIKAVEQLPDKMKTQHIGGLIKKNMQIIASTIKSNTPVSKSNKIRKRYRKGGELAAEYSSGNLKRSIGVKIIKTKDGQVSGWAGIQKKRGADGYYGFFLERGTKYINPPLRFIEKSAAIAVPISKNNLETDITEYIVKNAQKLGLNAK